MLSSLTVPLSYLPSLRALTGITHSPAAAGPDDLEKQRHACDYDETYSLKTSEPPYDIFPHASPRGPRHASVQVDNSRPRFLDSSQNSALPCSVHSLPSGDSLHVESQMPLDYFSSSTSRTSLSSLENPPNLSHQALMHSPGFPPNYSLNTCFLQSFYLKDYLGSGGYGFVMTAVHVLENKEVAVKFIIKDKVPEHAWSVDSVFGRIPTEVLLLTVVDHPGIVKCFDLFEDDIYYYLVQELHGEPWEPRCHGTSPGKSDSSLFYFESEHALFSPDDPEVYSKLARPEYSRRPSHDLFEFIEQSPHRRVSEKNARYIFAQIVDAVAYLDSQGISHCDLKDENILICSDLQVKLIDFGSAVFVDPTQPRPFYNLFFGTTAYAASEILRKKPYRAAPAEVWSLGVLLSYLLTGGSPFPTEQDAIDGRVVISSGMGRKLSKGAIGMMRLCLEPEPEKRATILDVKKHQWIN